MPYKDPEAKRASDAAYRAATREKKVVWNAAYAASIHGQTVRSLLHARFNSLRRGTR